MRATRKFGAIWRTEHEIRHHKGLRGMDTEGAYKPRAGPTTVARIGVKRAGGLK